jgi:hypothetical protein
MKSRRRLSMMVRAQARERRVLLVAAFPWRVVIGIIRRKTPCEELTKRSA